VRELSTGHDRMITVLAELVWLQSEETWSSPWPTVATGAVEVCSSARTAELSESTVVTALHRRHSTDHSGSSWFAARSAREPGTADVVVQLVGL
jgi:hypothetical protein